LSQRRTGVDSRVPEGIPMNDLDIVCKGTVIIGLAGSPVPAARS
jgi:hypothetical protein